MFELADLVRLHGDQYRQTHRLPLRQLKVLRAVDVCRTAALGGHRDKCDTCGAVRVSYNSCRDQQEAGSAAERQGWQRTANRHCPKCQGRAAKRWLENRRQDLLPVAYHHIVFTVPESLNPLALRNQKVVYDILFKAAQETLRELSRDARYIGAEIGITAILHTWGQNLMDHPHLHCLVTGGGLAPDGNRWIATKRPDFFLPVKVQSPCRL